MTHEQRIEAAAKAVCEAQGYDFDTDPLPGGKEHAIETARSAVAAYLGNDVVASSRTLQAFIVACHSHTLAGKELTRLFAERFPDEKDVPEPANTLVASAILKTREARAMLSASPLADRGKR